MLVDFSSWLNINESTNKYLKEFFEKYFNTMEKIYDSEFNETNTIVDFINRMLVKEGKDEKSLANWLNSKGIEIIKKSLNTEISPEKIESYLCNIKCYELRLRCAIEDAEQFQDRESLYLALIDLPICIQNDLVYFQMYNKIIIENLWSEIDSSWLIGIKPAYEQAIAL